MHHPPFTICSDISESEARSRPPHVAKSACQSAPPYSATRCTARRALGGTGHAAPLSSSARVHRPNLAIDAAADRTSQRTKCISIQVKMPHLRDGMRTRADFARDRARRARRHLTTDPQQNSDGRLRGGRAPLGVARSGSAKSRARRCTPNAHSLLTRPVTPSVAARQHSHPGLEVDRATR